MSLGDDIRDDVIEELGTQLTILRDSGNIAGEYCLYDTNRQVTKPFIREFFLEAVMAYDTQVNAGDLIQFDVDGRTFLVMNKTPEHFENAPTEQQTVLHKCNVSGEFWRPSGETWGNPNTFHTHKDPKWQLVRAGAYALLTESLFGHELEVDEELGQLHMEKHELYVPHFYGIRVGDRFEPVSGEFVQVDTIKKRRYQSIDVCEVTEDTR